jgi:hypothetical protein
MGLANIEDTFERMAKALERMADASEASLKALAAARNPASVLADAVVRNMEAPAKAELGARNRPPVAEPISYEQINKAVLGYSDKFGQAAAIALLTKFGAKIIKDLKADPSKYADVLEATKVGP